MFGLGNLSKREIYRARYLIKMSPNCLAAFRGGVGDCCMLCETMIPNDEQQVFPRIDRTEVHGIVL